MALIRIIQSSPKLGVLEYNLEQHCQAITQAGSDGVDLLVFPELSLTGYLLKDLVPDVALQAELLLSRFKCLSGIRGIEVILGFAEVSSGYRYHNSAAVLRWDAEGCLSLVHVHRKLYLPTYGMFDEGRYFTPGKKIRVVDSQALGRVGILLCEDAWHVSVPLVQALDGPNNEGAHSFVILSSSPARGIAPQVAGIPGSHGTWQNLTSTYASLLDSLVVYANRAGVEDGLVFAGGSRVVAPGGVTLAEGGLFSPDKVDVTLEWPGLLRSHRISSPLSSSENVDLLKREIHRVSEA